MERNYLGIPPHAVSDSTLLWLIANILIRAEADRTGRDPYQLGAELLPGAQLLQEVPYRGALRDLMEERATKGQ